MTANSVKSVSIDGYDITIEAEGCPPEYQDEISVIVRLDVAESSSPYIHYLDGTRSRYSYRRMDESGKNWSISVNPYKDGGKFEVFNILSIDKNVNQNRLYSTLIGEQDIKLSVPKGSYEAKVFSLAGRAILSKEIVSQGGVNSSEISTATLAPGVYLLNVNSAGKSVINEKFMVK